MNGTHPSTPSKQKALLMTVCLVTCCFLLSGCSLLPFLGENTVASVPLPTGESPDLANTPAFLEQTDSLTEILARDNTVQPSSETAVQMKAVWISYLEFDRILKGKSEPEFVQNLTAMMQDLNAKGFDTVFVQVRSHGDAYYPSQLFPWAQYASGKTGKACEFDPFALLIEEAKKQQLAVHAWVNLFRLMPEEALSNLSPDYQIRQWYDTADEKKPHMAKADNGTWYLNPNHPEVQQLIVDGVDELTATYDIQGVHVDDYFYDKVKPEAFGDTTEQGRDAVSALVKKMNQAVKTADETLLFGVSPAGNIKNGKPVSDRTQLTDIVRWTKEDGYLDYIAPQIYWDDQDPVAPFGNILEGWISFMEESDKTLYIGLAGYKFAKDDRLADQMTQLEEHQAVSGMIIFRYDDIAN